jgi:NADPH-dependent ferric siderophore reductase
VARDFTPRRFDRDCNQLWIDFFLHEAGPAAAWAAQAAIGQTLEVGGPKGSAVLELDGIDSMVLIGDETALPAIGRRLEELPSHIHALVVVESDDSADRPSLTSAAALQVVWVSREQDQVAERPEEQLIAALRRLDFPAGRCFAWVAHESGVARSIRAYLRDERGLDKKWIKAAGYWRRGATGSHENITD